MRLHNVLSFLYLVSLIMLLNACGGDESDPTPAPTILAPVVTGVFQPEGQLTITFETTGTYSEGNIFTAQLSDGNGSFSNPAAIGTLASLTGGTINATLPANVTNGNAYRIRVVASAPATIGPDNGADLSIAAPTLSITNVTASGVFIPGKEVTINTTVTGTFASCNSFTLQLSNATGEFTNPIQLGTNVGSLNASEQAVLPNNAAAGNGYRLRWVSSCPVVTGTPSEPFAIVIPTLGAPELVANLVAGGEVSVKIPYSNGPWNPLNNTIVQLSDASGNFASPVTISTLNTTLGASGTQQLITGYIPANTTPGSSYKIRVVTTNPQVISQTTANLTIGALPTLTLEPATPVFTKMYAGDRFGSNYVFKITRTGQINSLNNVRLEISSAGQPFGNPAAIISLNATQVNELVSLGNTNIIVTLNNTIGNGVRRFRAIATTHPGVVSAELNFNVVQTKLNGLGGTVAGTPYTFDIGKAFYNTNSATNVNNQVFFALGDAASNLYGEAIMRVFIGVKPVNDNIQTGAQTGFVFIHLLNSANQTVATFGNNNVNLSVSGAPGEYFISIGAVSLSRTSGTLGNSTLAIQDFSCGFSM
jgi:hypothetical protein